MTHEEILSQIDLSLKDRAIYSAASPHLNLVHISDAKSITLKAMEKSTEFWVKQWNYAQEQLASKDKEIAELKEAATELVQLKYWKDKHGKDEHYTQNVSRCWTNLKNLLT